MGWIQGVIHVSKLHSFVDHLNQKSSFIKMTGVTLPGREDVLPFFAIHKQAIILIAPDESETHLEKQAGEQAPHHVECMLEDVVIQGELKVRKGVRLSDGLAQHEGFLVLRHTVLRGFSDGQVVERRVPVAIVNDDALIGIAESSTAT